KLQLFHHRPEWQDDFAVEFVEHLRQARVNRGESAENSHVACELFETRTCVNEIANRQEKEKNRQRTENDLPGDMQAQRANEHHCGEQTPHEKISCHRCVVGGRGPSYLWQNNQHYEREPEQAVRKKRSGGEGVAFPPF